MMSAFERLEQLATELVGDGKSPNLYFVTWNDRVQTVTLDRRLAYQQWCVLATRAEVCALEDREAGVLCSVEVGEDGRLVRTDDYARLTGDVGVDATTPEEAADAARRAREVFGRFRALRAGDVD
jgi:hypothetical protein